MEYHHIPIPNINYKPKDVPQRVHRCKVRNWLITLVFLFLISCQLDSDICPTAPAKHVLLVYMGGDNNLSGETYEKVEAMRSGWLAKEGDKLLIYQDTEGAAPTLVELVNQNGTIVRQTIKNYPEENSADPVVFARVISEVKMLYPKAEYGLLLFSHASGWLPQGTLLQPRSTISTRSIIIDRYNEMTIGDFTRSIPDGMFHYIVFEACFMGGIEVAYQLKDKTNYLLVSSAEIVSPGFTEVYPQVINYLFEGDLTLFGQTCFNYFHKQMGWMQSATFSLIKTSELEPLARFVKANCDRDKEININDIQHFDRYSYRLFFDFEDYYSHLLATDTQRAYFATLVDKAVVWKSSTPSFMFEYSGFTIDRHSGLTTYIPQKRFSFLNQEYLKLAWSIAVSSP